MWMLLLDLSLTSRLNVIADQADDHVTTGQDNAHPQHPKTPQEQLQTLQIPIQLQTCP